MNKVINVKDALCKIKDNDSILIGNLGNDALTLSVIKTLGETKAQDLFFVTVDSAINSNPVFKEILTLRTRGLITTALEIGSLPSTVSNEIASEDILIERIRAGGSGIPFFYVLGTGEESKIIDGKECVKESAIKGDVAIIRAKKADLEGNCYLPSGSVRKCNMYLPFSAKYVIAIVDEIVPVGEIAPEDVSIPGILIEAIVKSS